jgi:ubiquinone/menaquinone biosynthesis C-methylase UbiE
MSNANIPTRRELSILSQGLSKIARLDGHSSEFDAHEGDALKRAVGSLYGYCTNVANSSNFWNFGLFEEQTDVKLRGLIENYDCEVSDGFSEQLYFYSLNTLAIERFDDLRILEVGCGLGAGLNFLSRVIEGPHFTGIDICETAIKKAKSMYARHNVEFTIGDAENLHFEDGQFDIVFNIESCHNYPNIRKFLSEAARVLKPGGHLVVTDFFTNLRFDAFLKMLEQAGLHPAHQKDISELVKASIRRRLKPDSFAMRHFHESIGTNFAKKMMLKQLYEVALGSELVDHTSDFLSRTAHRLLLPASKRFTGDKYLVQTAVKA